MSWTLRHFLLLLGVLYLITAIVMGSTGTILFPADQLSWIYPFRGYPQFAAQDPFLTSRGYQDVPLFFYPFWAFVGKALSQGQVPLWNPLEGVGLSTGAQHGLGMYFPLHWLTYSLFEPLTAWHLDLTVQFFLAGAFSFALFRRWCGCGRAATIGALAWTLGGWHAGFFLEGAAAWPLVFFPLVLLGIEDVQERRLRGASMLVVGVAGSLLAGHLQLTIASALLVTAILLVRPLKRKPLLLLAMLAGVLVAAPHIVSLVELIMLSDREKRSIATTLTALLAPREYLGLLFPNLMGNPSDGFYLGRSLGSLIIDPREHGLYMGQLPFLLALLGAYRTKTRSARLVSGWAIFGIILAGFPMLYQGLIYVCPPLLYVTPLRFLPFVLFALCYLSCLGWQSLEKDALTQKEKSLFASLIGLTFLGVASFVLPASTGSPAFPTWLIGLSQNGGIAKPAYFEGSFGEVILARIVSHFSLTSSAIWVPSLTLLLGLLAITMIRERKPRFIAVIALICLDLCLFFFQMNVPVNKSLFYPDLPEVRELAINTTLGPPGSDIPRRVLGKGRGIHPNILLCYGVATLESYESLQPGDFRQIFHYLNGDRPLPHQIASTTSEQGLTAGFLDLFGIVRLYNHPVVNEGDRPQGNLRIEALRPTALRAFLSNRWEIIEDTAQLFAPDFDPREAVLLDAPASFQSETSEPVFKTVEATIYGTNTVSFFVSPEEPCLLVLTDFDYPGWKATVNGEPVTIHKAYSLLRAVELKGGPATVVFTFRPTGWIGIWLCVLLGLVILIGCTFFEKNRNGKT